MTLVSAGNQGLVSAVRHNRTLQVWTGFKLGKEGGSAHSRIRHSSPVEVWIPYFVDRGSMGGRIRSRSRSGVKPQGKWPCGYPGGAPTASVPASLHIAVE